MINRTIAPMLLAAAVSIAATTAAQAESAALFTSVDVAKDSHYLYLGGVIALNGDINKDGFLARASVGIGEYDYTTTGTKINGDVVAADLMIGYQNFFSGGRVTGYIGGGYQDHDLSPADALNPVSGDEFGVKGQLEGAFDLTSNLNANIIGNYSTVNDSYWSRVRVGYDLGGVQIGPEGLALGSDSFDQQRVGGFAGIDLGGNLNASISVGYASTDGRGSDGVYGTIGFSITF